MGGAQAVLSPGLEPKTDWDLEILKLRVEGARYAITRARFVFLASTIAALAIFIAEFNAYISWYRRFPLKFVYPPNDVTTDAFKKVLEQYVESRVITVSLLGIHIGVSDLAILGTIALFVFAIWAFFNIRKHNHLIGRLLISTQHDPPERRKFVYYGISSLLVFSTVSNYHKPISRLGPIDREKDYLDYQETWQSKILRTAVAGLFMLPAIVSFSTIIFDLLSMFLLQSAFSFPHEALGYTGLGIHYQVQFVVMEIIGLAFSVATTYLCVQILGFEKSTVMVLREYARMDSTPQIDPAALREFAARYTAAWCSHNPASVAACFSLAASLTVNDRPPAAGRAQITELARSFMTTFPDLKVIMDDLRVQPDYAEYHWTLIGTNIGTGGTGNRVRISGFEKWRMGADGLIASSQGHFDAEEYQRQITGTRG